MPDSDGDHRTASMGNAAGRHSEAVKAGDSIARATDKPAEVQQIEKSFADFLAAVPDFQKTPENVEALMSHISWVRLPTVDDLTEAHALAHYRNEYKAPEVQVETDPQKMSMEQLHGAVFGVPEQSPEWAMPMQQLKESVFGPSPTEDAWSMDISKLKQEAGLES